jgi:hypothetical protein
MKNIILALMSTAILVGFAGFTTGCGDKEEDTAADTSVAEDQDSGSDAGDEDSGQDAGTEEE